MDVWIVVVTAVCVFLVGLLFMSRYGSGAAPVNAKKREMGEFTRAQVAKHNTRDDVWIILNLDGTTKVYDVTGYLDEHPGGDAMLVNAGGDSTESFSGPQHPPRVHDMIEDFCIGTVVD